MRRWIVAVATVLGLLTAGPALADREPQLPRTFPADLDFVYLSGGDGKYLYLAVARPETPAQAQPLTWFLIGFSDTDNMGASLRQLDCEGGRIRSFGALTIDRDGRTVDEDPRTPEWTQIRENTVGEDALALACRTGMSDEPILHGLPAIVADIAERRRQDDN